MKKSVLIRIAISMTLIFNLFSLQELKAQWISLTNVTSSFYSPKIQIDSDGNIYKLSRTTNAVTINGILISQSSSNYGNFLSKFDKSGNLLWIKNYGYTGINDDGQSDFVVTADNKIYMAARFLDPLTINGIVYSSTTTGLPYIMLINPSNGNVSSQLFASRHILSSIYMYSDRQSNAYVSYYESNPATVGGLYLNNFNGSLKIENASLNLSTIDGIPELVSSPISNIDYTAGGNQIYKYNNGQLTSIVTVKGQAFLRGMKVDLEGNLIAVGGFKSAEISIAGQSLINSNPSGGTYDYFMMKCDAQGNLIWINKIANSLNSSSDYYLKFDIDGSSNIHVLGQIFNQITFLGVNLTQKSLSRDATLLRYNSSGVLDSARQISSSLYTAFYTINISNEGRMYVTGAYASNTIAGTGLTIAASDNYVNEFLWYVGSVTGKTPTIVGINTTSGPGTCSLTAPGISVTNHQLEVQPANALYAYSWYLNGVSILGINNSMIIPTVSGVYTVFYSNGTCTSPVSSSVNFSLDITNIKTSKIDPFSIYPNPGEGIFNISDNIEIESIYNVYGQNVHYSVDTQKLYIEKKGIVFLRMKDGSVIRVVVY